MLKTLFLNYRTLSVLNTDIGRQVDALNSYIAIDKDTRTTVCVQLRTSADNEALPAFGRAAAGDRRPAGRAAIDRCLLGAGPTAANPQQRRAAAG